VGRSHLFSPYLLAAAAASLLGDKFYAYTVPRGLLHDSEL
jgi:hypothetical protein